MNYIIHLILSFSISLLMYYIYINKFNFVSQTERELGPKSHKNKNGTITMGGIVFVLVTFVYSLFIVDLNIKKRLFLYLPFISFFILGFMDDYLIVKRHNNNGIPPSLKLFIQIIISAICFIVFLKLGLKTSVSFFKYQFDLKWAYGLLILFMLIGGSNAVNLTDGIDGLCGLSSVITLLGLLYVSLRKEETGITIFILILLGSLLAFLFFNLPKAKVFMGDTGSLALGAILVSLAIILKVELLILVLGFVFIIEALSVIIQVVYYKITKKRFFKMAPLHHHFELMGMNEIEVLKLFITIDVIILLIFLFFY